MEIIDFTNSKVNILSNLTLIVLFERNLSNQKITS